MPYGTLITRHVVPNVPQYTAKNGAVCYSPDNPSKLSLSTEMKWHCRFLYDIPFFAELPQDYETATDRYTYSWVRTPPASCSALNSTIANLIQHDRWRYTDMYTTATTDGRHHEAFTVGGNVYYNNDNYVYFDFDFSLMWSPNLTYWEWYSPHGEFLWVWQYRETRTDKRTGQVTTSTRTVNADASYTLPVPSQWVQTYSTAAKFCQDHPNDELRLGDSILLVPVAMSNQYNPVTGDITNYQGTAFGSTAIELSATYA